MPKIQYRLLLPEQVKQTYDAVKDYLPDSLRELNSFIALYLSKDSMFLEIGDFQGVVWLSNIIPGWKANVHIVLWDKDIHGQYTEGNRIERELAQLLRLRRITAYIPSTFTPAIHFAEQLGFVYEGLHRLADRYNEELVDVYSYALLEEVIYGRL
jgi:RimJ/RimL family protein N-acetyltransferase